MRRRSSGIGKYIFIGIIVVVGILFVVKTLVGNNNKKYTNYVKKYEEGLQSFLKNDNNAEVSSYNFEEITKTLIDKGFISEFEDSSVYISGEDIIIVNDGENISFYNYNDGNTLENKFEISFTKNEKTYICTKNDCR